MIQNVQNGRSTCSQSIEVGKFVYFLETHIVCQGCRPNEDNVCIT